MIRLQDVHDGYTESLKIGGDTVLFRRMLASERKMVLHRASRMANATAMRFLEDAIYSRLVWGYIDFREISQAVAECVVKEVVGCGTFERELEDVANLSSGVVIERKYPWLAKRSCDFCKKWWWSPLTGELTREGMDGPALERDPSQELMCVDGMCPKGSPEKPKTLSAKNRWAWDHFRQCDATGSFPDDPIVRRNAQVIRQALKKAG